MIKTRTTRKLNGKLLLYMIGITALLVVGVHVVHGIQVKRSARGLLIQADRAEQQGRLADVEVYLGRYLAYRPDDTEVLARYARTLEQRAQTDAARRQVFQIQQKVLQHEPDDRDTRRRLVRMAVQLREYTTAETNATILLQPPSPADGELKYWLGRCKEGTGRFEEAVALYEEARKREPSRVDTYVRLADLLRTRLHDPQRADRVVNARGGEDRGRDGLIAVLGNSAEAHLARARYRARFDIAGAPDDVARALALDGTDAEVILAAAGVARQRGDLDAARDLLGRGVGRHPRDARMYQAAGALEQQEGRLEEALAWLRKGTQALPEEAGLKWALAELLILAGKPDEAAAVVDDLRRRHLKPELAAYLDAQVQMTRGHWSEAAKLLAGAQVDLAARGGTRAFGKRALIMLAQCYERLGDLDRCYTAYRQAVAIDLDPDPYWVPARLGLAATLVALNRGDEALNEYQVILPREPRAGIAMAQLQVLRNLRRAPRERNWSEVEQALTAAERALPGAPELVIIRAEVAAARDQLQVARDLLEGARARQPQRVDLWVASAGLEAQEGKPEAALAILDEAQQHVGDRVELRLARAGYVARSGGDTAAGALAQLEQGVEAFTAEERVRLRQALAGAYLQIGQVRQAERLWRQLAEERPNDLGLRLLLFDLALQSGDEAAASQALDPIRRIEGEDGSLGPYARAVLLIRRARTTPAGAPAALAEARALLARVAKRRPGWSRVPLALGEIEELSGNPEAAIQDYQRAIVELGERNPVPIRRLVQLLGERQRFAEVDLVIRRLREDRTPLSGDLQRLAAQVAYRNQDYGHALAEAQQVVSEQSDDYRDLIWLGQLRRAAGQPAEPLFRRAVALAPKAPEAWLALVANLAGTDQQDKARAVIQEAERALPEDGADLILAQCHEMIGRTDQAETRYQAALTARPDDLLALRAAASFYLRCGRLRDAEPLLQKVINLKTDETTVAWARRLLATVTALGGQRQSLKALEILGLAEDTGSVRAPTAASDEDLRTKAAILALRPSRAARREAIAILQGLVERQGTAVQAQDLFLLAQLEEADGNWAEARRQMLVLLNARGKDPAYLAHYVRALLRHGQADEAQAYLVKLEQLAPGQPGTIELKARVLAARGQAAEAVTLLETFARGDAARLSAVAPLLEELGQDAAAERMYREDVAQSRARRPEVVLALAGFLGRHGRTKEALDLCDGAWQTCPPEAVADASIGILYKVPHDVEQQRRVDRRLQEAIRQHPDQVALQFAEANLRSLQGRYDDAAALFQALAAKHKDFSGPLNNLAWMLALQDGKGAEALAHITRAIEIDGPVPSLLDTRALAYLALGRTADAIRDLEDAIAVRPSADMYFHLAQAYRKTGRAAEARDAFQRAKDLGLSLDSLHPLEQDAYHQLLAGLAQR